MIELKQTKLNQEILFLLFIRLRILIKANRLIIIFFFFCCYIYINNINYNVRKYSIKLLI